MNEMIINSKKDNLRVDTYIVEELNDISRSSVQKLIIRGNVAVNEKVIKQNYKVRIGDVIKIIIPDPVKLDVKPEDIDIDIFYEDDDVAIVNKPQGLVVHPAPGNTEGTLVNALLFKLNKLSSINGVIRPGIVHRIDKNTSGLLMIAKNDKAHNCLSAQLKEHTVNRIYYALVEGIIKENKGKIDASIGRSQKDRKKMAVTDKNSKRAVTNFEVLERFKKFTYLKLKLETGRTHQIRVHMKYIGHPVVGDTTYGYKNAKFGLKGQLLHAKTIGFVHPTTRDYMEFNSELPKYFDDILNNIRNMER